MRFCMKLGYRPPVFGDGVTRRPPPRPTLKYSRSTRSSYTDLVLVQEHIKGFWCSHTHTSFKLPWIRISFPCVCVWRIMREVWSILYFFCRIFIPTPIWFYRDCTGLTCRSNAGKVPTYPIKSLLRSGMRGGHLSASWGYNWRPLNLSNITVIW